MLTQGIHTLKFSKVKNWRFPIPGTETWVSGEPFCRRSLDSSVVVRFFISGWRCRANSFLACGAARSRFL
jgi:hypothetical protein